MSMESKMKIQHFAILSIVLALLSFLQPAFAAENGYEEIEPIKQFEPGSAVEVAEYFWFGCPHCYAFEPEINAWAAHIPEGVELVREAPPLNRSWLPQSQAFYAAELLGLTETIMEPMFTAIHKSKRSLRKPQQIIEFVGELGVDKEVFERVMNSFAVDVRIKRSLQLARAAGITGVPTVIIDGKYKTSATIAGGSQRAIQVIDTLSRDALKARQGS